MNAVKCDWKWLLTELWLKIKCGREKRLSLYREGILLRPNPGMRDMLWKRKQTWLIAVARCVSRGITQVPLLCGPSTAVFSTVQERWLMKYLMNLVCVPQRNTQQWSRMQLSGYKLESGMKTTRKSSATDCLKCIKFLPRDKNGILDYL